MRKAYLPALNLWAVYYPNGTQAGLFGTPQEADFFISQNS